MESTTSPILSKESGCHGWQAEYDEQDQRTVVTYLGLDDGSRYSLPTAMRHLSRATIHAAIRHGRPTMESTTSPSCPRESGCHGWQAEYDEQDQRTVVTYLGLDGKPILVADGYATFKSSYDSHGNKTRGNYYGVNGEPVLSKKDGYHGWQSNYDEHGNETVVTYLGLDGKPILVADGCMPLKSSYDSRGNKTRQTYYGVNGEPVLSKKDGYHGWQAE